jgi:predicted Holliday junction resolvase-like endonuclease
MNFPFIFHFEISVSIVIATVLFIIVILQAWFLRYLNNRLSALNFQKRSQSTKYGKMTEQFLPFLDVFPWDANQFRFLGTPIDGVQFEEDRIILIEFKSSGSTLSNRQKKIKKLIETKQVFFEEIRIDI